MKDPLFKTTIVIWSEFESDSIEHLAREATSGDAYARRRRSS